MLGIPPPAELPEKTAEITPQDLSWRCAVKDKTVKDLMVSLSDYATIYEDQTLFEALLALETALLVMNSVFSVRPATSLMDAVICSVEAAIRLRLDAA